MNKLNKLAVLAAICCGSPALAQEVGRAHYESSEFAPLGIARVSHCDCGEMACGCDSAAPEPGCGTEMMRTYEPLCGVDYDRQTQMSGDGSCGTGGLLDQLTACDLQEPWVLFGEACGWSAGGWIQMGYHNAALPAFNNRPDEFQLHQAWLYAEKSIDTSNGFDLGGRIDYLYGTDGPNTQAFGTGNRGWDNNWDNGPDDSGYGHAIPQAYFEAGYGDLSVKLGHFYTIIGYEVVQATGNFFYSHAYTFNYSEPFTHSGALATYKVTEDITAYGGYVFGWDSGFDDNGDAFLGGLSANITEDLNVTYAAVAGRFGQTPLGNPEQGFMQSVVANLAVTEKLNYIFQTDLLDTEGPAGDAVRKTFDINQYLIYSLSDCLAAGTRFEWYDADTGIFGNGSGTDVYALTGGLNYKPHANVTIRPELRHDWVFGSEKTGVLENDRVRQTTFGIDTIFTF